MSDAPRVTIEQIESKIAREHYFSALDGAMYEAGHLDGNYERIADHESLSLMTFCVLVLNNGHKIAGQSACVSAKNYDYALGRKYAREDAIRQMWPLEGYLLSENLYREHGE